MPPQKLQVLMYVPSLRRHQGLADDVVPLLSHLCRYYRRNKCLQVALEIAEAITPVKPRSVPGSHSMDTRHNMGVTFSLSMSLYLCLSSPFPFFLITLIKMCARCSQYPWPRPGVKEGCHVLHPISWCAAQVHDGHLYSGSSKKSAGGRRGW